MPGASRRPRRLKQSVSSGELSDFSIVNPQDGDLLIYDGTDGRFENARSLTGDYTLAGQLTATDLLITDDVTINDALIVGGNAGIAGDLSVTGVATLNGNTTVAGTLGVTGVTSLSDALSVAGTLTGSGFSFNGNGQIDGDLNVDGTITGDYVVSGDQAFDSLTLTGALTAADAVLSGSVTAASVSATSAAFASLAISGAMTVANQLCISGAFCLDYNPGAGDTEAQISISDDDITLRLHGFWDSVGDGTGSTAVDFANFDPAGRGTIFYNGSEAFASDALGMEIYGIDTDDDPALRFSESQGGTLRAQVRTTSSGFLIDNRFNSGASNRVLQLRGINGSASIQTMLVLDPEAGMDAYYDGAVRMSVESAGVHINSADAYLRLYLADTTTLQAQLQSVSGELRLTNQVASEHLLLRGTNVGAGTAVLLEGDPDGALTGYHNNSAMFRTVAAASGGLEVNNTSTGSGFERVLTTSDAGGGGGGSLVQTVDDGTAAELRFNGVQVFQTQAGGAILQDNAGDQPILAFGDDGGTTRGFVFSNGTSDDFIIRNTVHGNNVNLEAEDAVGTVQSLFVGDPDGASSMFYDGTVAFNTRNDGAEVTASSTGLNTGLYITDGDAGQARLIKVDGGGGALLIRNDDNGGAITFQADNNAGTRNTLVDADPDSGVELFYQGTIAAESTASGFSISDTSGSAPILAFRDDTQALLGEVQSNGTDFFVQSLVHGGKFRVTAEDAGGTNQELINADPDSGIAFNGQTSVAPPTYTVTNDVTDRTFDANTVAIAELADIVGTIIADLQANGLFQ